jgi:hypothetical protein
VSASCLAAHEQHHAHQAATSSARAPLPRLPHQLLSAAGQHGLLEVVAARVAQPALAVQVVLALVLSWVLQLVCWVPAWAQEIARLHVSMGCSMGCGDALYIDARSTQLRQASIHTELELAGCWYHTPC